MIERIVARSIGAVAILLAACSPVAPSPAANPVSAPRQVTRPAAQQPAPAVASEHAAQAHQPEADHQTPAAVVPPPSEWSAPASVGTSPEGNPWPVLPRFFTALLRIEEGERDDHARIIWFGDSHTQPDIWTHAVRQPLQARFGNGGPGFMHVGWKKWGYRHTGADLSVHGKWRIQPPRLLTVETYDDGVLGLGGVRLLPQPGSRASIEVNAATLPGPARWELAFRTTSDDAQLRIRPADGEVIELGHDPDAPGVRHATWSTAGPGGGFEVEAVRGQSQLFGVVAETSGRPGVVLDVLGLNGARVVHTLTWDEPTWTAALARRKPDLIVLAYGTNESGIRHLSMERHRQRLVRLLDRGRSGSPTADCLIIGAMDRGDAAMSEKIERINEAQAEAAKERGCAFWSAQAAMGGRNSMQKWVGEDPPLGAPDRVHLKVRGYRRLGAALARDLLDGFDAGRRTAPVPATDGGKRSDVPE